MATVLFYIVALLHVIFTGIENLSFVTICTVIL